MFRSTLSITFYLFAAVPSALPLDAQSDLRRELIAADRGLLEAIAGAHPNVGIYEQALAPDYIDIELGAVHSREEVVKQAKIVRSFSYEYENPHAVPLSPTSGFVVAEVTYSGVLNGTGVHNRVLSTTIFSFEHGQWIAHLQMLEPAKIAERHVADVPDSNPTLIALRNLAAKVEEQFHVPGYPGFARPTVILDAGTAISYFNDADRTVHTALFADLPTPMQGLWNQWRIYTADEPTGESLFDDMFHRFFFVHELGHWMTSQVIAGLSESEMIVARKNEANNKWEREIAANRIAVAWYREHDPDYLAKLVADFRRIQAHLPDPVPPGIDEKTYFTENYDKLGTDPTAYGWYQLQMVLVVYDESVRSFQQIINELPKNRYE